MPDGNRTFHGVPARGQATQTPGRYTAPRKFGLDVVRACAISLVLVAHFEKRLDFVGIYGVELFFALSGFLIGGIVAIETIFAYPGLGRLLIFALQRQDLPLMQAAILVLTAVFCLANLAADLLYGIANPRIRYGGAVG